MGPFSPIIGLWSIPDCLKHQFPQGKNFTFKIWILQMIELHTVVVGNQQKLCSVHKCPLLLLAQEDITIQIPPCHQEHLGNALHLLLHGRMIHEAQAHPNLFHFLRAPHACLPVLYSGRRDSTGTLILKHCVFLTFLRMSNIRFVLTPYRLIFKIYAMQ